MTKFKAKKKIVSAKAWAILHEGKLDTGIVPGYTNDLCSFRVFATRRGAEFSAWKGSKIKRVTISWEEK